jgi:glycosyltransferase involved in cell wall biosynthesis
MSDFGKIIGPTEVGDLTSNTRRVKEKPRVIVFRSELLPPSETFIKEQALALTRWRPILVGRRLSTNGLALDGLVVRLTDAASPGLLTRIASGACQWLNIANPLVLKVLADVDAQLVHAHFGLDAVDIWPTVRKLRLPMLVTLHGYDINIYREWWEMGKGGRRRRSYPRRLLQLAQAANVHFVAVSEAIRLRAMEYGISPDKISVRYVGVDTEQFRPEATPIDQRPKRILFVGRLVEKKGVEYLIRALVSIRVEVPDAELMIVGDGPLRTYLENLSNSLGLNARFLGIATSAEVREQMRWARVFCLPSVTAKNGDAEGFGLVLLEAQACGIPVVTSALGGSTEGICDGKTGFRVPEGDVESLSALLKRLLLDSRLSSEFSVNAAAFARRNFDLKICTRLLEESYDSSLERFCEIN